MVRGNAERPYGTRAPELRGNAGRTRRAGSGRGLRERVAEATGLGADAAARAQEAGRGDRKSEAFVRPPRPLRPLASRPPPAPCPWRAGLLGPAVRAPALVLFGLGEEGQLFPGRVPPPSLSAHAPSCAAEPYWLRARACSEARGPTSAAPSTRPTVNCLQAGSKDAGGSDWLRRARPPGFSAPAAAVAAITEFPVVSVRS